MSIEGNSELASRPASEEMYTYPGSQTQPYSNSPLPNYLYNSAVQGSSSEYSYNNRDANANNGTYISRGGQQMSLKSEGGSWQMQNASAHSVAMAGSSYAGMNLSSQYYHSGSQASPQHSASVKFDDRYPPQPGLSPYNSANSQEFATRMAVMNAQGQYQRSFADQVLVKTEENNYRYNCSSTGGSGSGSGSGSAGSSSSSQETEYSTSQSQGATNMYMMGISGSTPGGATKSEVQDNSYYMQNSVTSTAYLPSMSVSSSAAYSDPLRNSLQQYKVKLEGGYYSSALGGASNSDYAAQSQAYGLDRYGYKRASPYDRVASQQAYRQRETPPGTLTPSMGSGHNYTVEEMQQTLAHRQQSGLIYGRPPGESGHQSLPQIDQVLYNRQATDSPRMVSPTSHIMYQHDSPQSRQQMTPPVGHHGAIYSQDPDMQQMQTLVQAYSSRQPDHQGALLDMDGEPPRTTPPVTWTDTKMDFPIQEVKDIAGTFLMLEKQLCEALRVLEFRSPVEYIYNPLEYAWEPHSNYVTRFCCSHKPVLFLGMNPGPFGMAQTGVPFGEVTLVKEWLGISGNVNKPVREHPKKLILGFDCPRSEISGSRFWGFFKKYCGKPENFFRYCFVHNICPLIFMNHNAKNITPPQLPVVERKPLNRLCSQHLCDTVRLLNTKIVIGIGKFAQDQAKMALEEAGITGVKVTWIMHPSPANPIANRGWEEVAKRQLEEIDVLKYIVDPTV